MKYDNSIILRSLCDIYKYDMTMNCIGDSCENLKVLSLNLKI